jgi:Protein of unknown function (DUF1580)
MGEIERELMRRFGMNEIPDIKRNDGSCVAADRAYRWARVGISGVRLKTQMSGGCRFTTTRWLIEFHQAVTDAREAQRDRTLAAAV